MKRDELEQCLRDGRSAYGIPPTTWRRFREGFTPARGRSAVRSLEKNGFAAHYAASRGEAAALLLSLIRTGLWWGWGTPHDLCLGLR